MVKLREGSAAYQLVAKYVHDLVNISTDPLGSRMLAEQETPKAPQISPTPSPAYDDVGSGILFFLTNRLTQH